MYNATLFNFAQGAVVLFAASTITSMLYVVSRKSQDRGFMTRLFWLSMAFLLGSGSAVLVLADPSIERLGRYGLEPTSRRVFAVLLLVGAIFVMFEGLFSDRQRLNKYIDNIARKMTLINDDDG